MISIQRYHTNEFKRKRKRRIIVYDSVTRYGPRTSCQREGLKIQSNKDSQIAASLSLSLSLSAFYSLDQIFRKDKVILVAEERSPRFPFKNV